MRGYRTCTGLSGHNEPRWADLGGRELRYNAVIEPDVLVPDEHPAAGLLKQCHIVAESGRKDNMRRPWYQLVYFGPTVRAPPLEPEGYQVRLI